jgi:nicotinamide mononucleotide (NMN) deamidase PncC
MDELVACAGRIAARLKARKETVAVAESSAGGLITAALLAVPGPSAYCLGGIVIYTRQAWARPAPPARPAIATATRPGMPAWR